MTPPLCQHTRRKTIVRICTTLLLAAAVIALATPALAGNVTGKVYTSKADGTTVNGNIYASKPDVYVNGGPQNEHGSQIAPDGVYYFQVTDPNGTVLLSTDDITCRQLVVSGGAIVGIPPGLPPSTCTTGYHAIGAADPVSGQTPVQLLPFNDTPNPGGEYKVWATPVGLWSETSCPNAMKVNGFCPSDSLTDNFKVQKPTVAYITVCKFNDLYDTGIQGDDPLLPHWSITATNVDTGSVFEGTVTKQTDDSGCTSFSVSHFPAANVTLSETLQAGWEQTAPQDTSNSNLCVLTGTVGTATCSASGGVITISGLTAGDNVGSPNFGNFCSDQNSCGVISVTKDAFPSFTRTYVWGITKSVDNMVIDTSSTAPQTFNYTVNVTHDSGTDSAWMIMGDITVSNSTTVDVVGVNVTDAVSDNGHCMVANGTSQTVPAGSHITLSYTCTYDSAPSSGTSGGTNTATATWGNNVQQSGTALYNFSTTPPNLVNGTVNVTDTLGGSLGTVSYSDPSPTTFTYSYNVTGTPGTCVSQGNTASVIDAATNNTLGTDNKTVQVCVGADLTVNKTAATAFTRTYAWSIGKTATPTSSACPGNPNACIATPSGTNGTFYYSVIASETGYNDTGWQVTGTITVQNPNDWEDVAGINVADALDAGSNGSCTVTGGTSITIPKSQSAMLNYTCTYSAAPAPYSGTNTGTATWSAATYYTPDGSKSGTAGYDFNSATITRVKQTVTITDNFNNGGPTTLGTLTATDAQPYTTQTYNYSHTVTAPTASCATYRNTAGITETGQTSSQTAEICGASPLSVSKTAAAAYTPGITKSSNQISPIEGGGTVTLSYTIMASESGWNVSGAITVMNPNNWEAITANLSDALNLSGSSCSIAGGSTQTVMPNSSITPAYLCTFTGVPTAANGTNTATASWNPSTYYTATGMASSGAIAWGFATMTVTDTFNNGTPVVLGMVSGITASVTYPYSTVVTVPPGTCVTYVNYATATENTTIPAVVTSNPVTSVTACNEKTGALTMGFWKNPNGQGIISSGAYTGTGRVCNSGTWLRQLNPFQDLSATATCSQVATYVNNVIGAANCSSGGTCNLMLKAQMLATALDVYFSTPSLGGNKIGPYNGLGNNTPALGGVPIDLSHICSMNDTNSGGTCTGVYEDTRPEFGIMPPPLGTTVQQMLNYANFASSTSNNGCSYGIGMLAVAQPSNGLTCWYRQIKNPKQVFAKDAFDNINNQIAPISPTAPGSPSF